MSAPNEDQRRAWINVVREEDANDELADSYRQAGARQGTQCDNILAVHSVHPRSMLDHLELYKTIMHRGSGLSRTEREILAVVVSTINECHY